MLERHKMKIRNIKPIVRLYAERLKHDELVFSGELDPKHVEAALDLLFLELQPQVLIRICPMDTWNIVNGESFVQALVEFVNGMHCYPDNGVLVEFRGKRFSELPKMAQYRLEQASIVATCYDSEEKPEHDAEFERLSSLIKGM